jgi:hypothetical protein
MQDHKLRLAMVVCRIKPEEGTCLGGTLPKCFPEAVLRAVGEGDCPGMRDKGFSISAIYRGRDGRENRLNAVLVGGAPVGVC